MAVRVTRPIVRSGWRVGQTISPPARLKWPVQRVDGEVIHITRAIGHLVWLIARVMWVIGRVMWPLPACLLMAERRFPRTDADFAAYMNNYYAAVEKFWSV